MTVYAGDVIAASDVNNLATLVDQLAGAVGSITTTALTTILTVTLPAPGTYEYSALLLITNTTTAGIPGFAIGGTSTPTAWWWAAGTTHYNTATSSQGISASGTTYPTTGQALANVNWTTTTGWSPVQVKGQVTVSAAGTLTMRLSETVAGTVTAQVGSIVTVRMVG